MLQERLSVLVIVSVENIRVRNLDLRSVVSDFAE